MKITQILNGPFDVDGMIWNVCQVSEGDLSWDEEIYYDTVGEALGDFEELRNSGYIDVDDDSLLDEDEEDICDDI